MVSLIDNLSDDWKVSSDTDAQDYKEYLICHRHPVSKDKTDFKYSASEEKQDSMPVELLLQGAKKRDPLQGIQRPMLKVKDAEIVGIDVCGDRCERTQ